MIHVPRDTVRKISSFALATLMAMLALAAWSADRVRAQSGTLVVKYDQSQILKLSRPVAEIIIGNPMIADVAIQSSQLLVITGKSFGVTNIIALDNDRNVIQDRRVMVQLDHSRVVYLRKGATRETYNCSPDCNPTVTVGDNTRFFAQTAQDSSRKIALIENQTAGAAFSNGGTKR